MTKRQHDEYTQRRELQDSGWKVYQKDSIRFNGGSETSAHLTCKALVGWFLSQQGYRICSEVENQSETAEADIIAYGNGEPPFIVECETNINETVRSKKLDQFYHGEPFVECHLLKVLDMPVDRMEALEWIQEQLGGEL